MIENVDEIRDSVSIVDVIKTYLPELEKRGTTWKACCPFHGEKTPSFSVSPAKNIFKCFGCGEGGDAVHFLIEHKKMTYSEALIEAARIGDVIVKYSKDKRPNDVIQKEREEFKVKEALVLCSEKVLQLYKQQMEKAFPEKLGEVSIWGRCYKPETIKKYQIGYAPAKVLTKEAAKGEFLDEQLKTVGYVRSGENGSYELFRNRIIFPIFSSFGRLKGKPVGMSGRIEKATKTVPKYINTPESIIWKKSKHLFGLWQNGREIRKLDSCLLVEGPTDVMTVDEAGFNNVVGSNGTALTNDQARLLKRFCGTVRVVYENDKNKAGYKAAIRNLETLINNGLKTEVCTFSKVGDDPDSFIRKNGAEAFAEVIEKSIDGLFWLISQDFEKGNPTKMAQAMTTAVRLLSNVSDEILRAMYIKQLCTAKWFGAGEKRNLEEQIQLKINESLEPIDEYSDLDPVQQRDSINYGIYIKRKGNKGSVFYKGEKNKEIALTAAFITCFPGRI